MATDKTQDKPGLKPKYNKYEGKSRFNENPDSHPENKNTVHEEIMRGSLTDTLIKENPAAGPDGAKEASKDSGDSQEPQGKQKAPKGE